MNKKKEITISQDERYYILVEECRAIIIETLFNSRMELLRGKWELGKKIVEEEKNFNEKVYGSKTILILADDLEISVSHLYKIIQFYKKYPLEIFEKVCEVLPEGKNISWYKICQELLPEDGKKKEEIELEKDCMHQVLKCDKCKKEFNLEEIKKWLR